MAKYRIKWDMNKYPIYSQRNWNWENKTIFGETNDGYVVDNVSDEKEAFEKFHEEIKQKFNVNPYNKFYLKAIRENKQIGEDKMFKKEKLEEVNISGKDIVKAYNDLYHEIISPVDIEHYTKVFDEWISKIKEWLKNPSSQKYSPVSLGNNYYGKKTKALMNVLGISVKNQSDLTNKLKQKLGEDKMKKKKNLDEGMILIAPLLPVGPRPTLSMRGNKKDNFVFKGLPGQFDENGKKIFDERGNVIKGFPLKEGVGADTWSMLEELYSRVNTMVTDRIIVDTDAVELKSAIDNLVEVYKKVLKGKLMGW